MIGTAFSFRGKIDRKTFALGYASAAAAMMAIGVAIILPLSFVLAWLKTTNLVSSDLLGALKALSITGTVIAVAVPYLWVLLALIAKRARSIGINPFLFTGALLLVGPLDVYLVRPLTKARFIWPFASMSLVGGLVTSLAFILLLFCPPMRGAEMPQPRKLPPKPDAGPQRSNFGMRGNDYHQS